MLCSPAREAVLLAVPTENYQPESQSVSLLSQELQESEESEELQELPESEELEEREEDC